MKSRNKKMYLSLAIVMCIILIIVLINIWLSKNNTDVQPLTNTPEQQSSIVFPVSLDDQVPQRPFSSPAITVIRPKPKEKPIVIAEEVEEEKQAIKKSPLLPKQNLSASDNSVTIDVTSDITKIETSSPLTEEQSQEMHKQGIVIW
jgi:hypothetical protein